MDIDSEPILIDFKQQIDDLWITSPDGDILISWDLDAWDDTQCFLIKPFDNSKEFGNMRITKFLAKAKNEGEKLTVYITIQRN